MKLSPEAEKLARDAYGGQASRKNRRLNRFGNRPEFRLTFDEWLNVWDQSGKWEHRGRGKDKFCLCMIDQDGHFEIGNVAVMLFGANASRAAIGNKYALGAERSEETRKKASIGAKKRFEDPEQRRLNSEQQKVAQNNPELKARKQAALRARLLPGQLSFGDIPGWRKARWELVGGICELCREPLDFKESASDHNHKTGQMRGVLHIKCNLLEGSVIRRAARAGISSSEKLANFMSNLARYHREHEQNPSGILHPKHKTEDQKKELRRKRAKRKQAQARVS